MICCLNPFCTSPETPEESKNCQSQNCQTPLISLKNRYYPLKMLGRGGFAKTYLAKDTDKLDEPCVIKQLVPQREGNEAESQFKQEAKRLQSLGKNHKRIPTLHAYFKAGDYLYIVQEYIPGNNLVQELNQRGIFKEAEVRVLLEDLLTILKFIHEPPNGLIHRDLKPDNIIRREGNGELVLIDFGISKELQENTASYSTIIGTRDFAPLEQVQGDTIYPASDLYSLGATCFHLLRGERPLDLYNKRGSHWVDNWQQYIQQPLSDGLKEIMNKLLQIEVEDRYQSAAEVLAALESLKKFVSPSLINKFKIAPQGFDYTLVGLAVVVAMMLWVIPLLREEQPRTIEPSPTDQGETVGKYGLRQTLVGHRQDVLAVAVSPHGKTIASGSRDHNILFWQVETGKKSQTIRDKDDIYGVAFSEDGAMLASGSKEKIKFWDVETRELIREIAAPSLVYSLAFSPDGSIIASGSEGKINLQDQKTGKLIQTIDTGDRAVLSVAFSGDGRIIAHGDLESQIKLWDVETGRLKREIDTGSEVLSVALSGDGKIIASGHKDGKIKLWDLLSEDLVKTIEAHEGNVSGLAFSGDGEFLVSGGDDELVKVWKLRD